MLWELKPKIPQEIEERIASLLSTHLLPSSYAKASEDGEGEGEKELLAQLFYNRGIIEENQVEDFLNPQYEKLHSPFLFKDMQKAVDRIWTAIDQKEKICIYGDYDADAVTANAVLQQTFRYLGVAVESYIPDRFSEGYGVNLDALSKIKDGGSKIIITVDCGTNSHDAAQFCKANGIDLIITDHHELIGAVPDAYALINPKNPDDNYPYSEITGVGVAFKLACGILSRVKGLGLRAKHVEGWEKWLLDLVAIGTVADCHSLLGENRILVKYGLKVLQKTRWVGLRAIMKSAGLDFNQKLPDVYTLGFVIAPRLNAAGRLEHANIALDLLLEQSPVVAQEKALRLDSINQRRQTLTQTVLSEAKEKIIHIQDRKILVMVGEGWPKGVMGLVAGRLAEEYYKPVIMLERTESLCTGSARTAGEFNLIEALKFSSEHLVKFGGHKQAAGLTLEISQFEPFYKKILERADASISGENSRQALDLEAELEEQDLQLSTYNLLTALEPFGVGNPKPKFLLKNARILSQRQAGANGQHLQLQLKIGSKFLPAVAFNFSPIAASAPDFFDIACELMEDGWNGRNDVKLKIVDIK